MEEKKGEAERQTVKKSLRITQITHDNSILSRTVANPNEMDNEVQISGLRALLRNRVLCVNLLIMIVLWTVTSFDYYMINFQLQFIQGNIFNNTMLSSISEISAYMLAGVLLEKINIKISFVVSYLISIAGSVTYMILGSTYPDYVPYMILGTKFGVSSAFNIVYLANARLFPPILSSTAYGICNLFARVATIMAPELAEV